MSVSEQITGVTNWYNQFTHSGKMVDNTGSILRLEIQDVGRELCKIPRKLSAARNVNYWLNNVCVLLKGKVNWPLFLDWVLSQWKGTATVEDQDELSSFWSNLWNKRQDTTTPVNGQETIPLADWLLPLRKKKGCKHHFFWNQVLKWIHGLISKLFDLHAPLKQQDKKV